MADSALLDATLTAAGSPAPGAPAGVTSDDPAVATVVAAPAADATGHLRPRVIARGVGVTTVRVSANGRVATVPVRVSAGFAGLPYLAFDGNSIMQHNGWQLRTALPDRIAALFPAIAAAGVGTGWNNFSVNGQRTEEMLADAAVQVFPKFQAGRHNVVFAWDDTNQLSNTNPHSSEQYLRDTEVQYCQQARAAGFLVAVATLLPRAAPYSDPSLTDDEWQAIRVAHNVWKRANWQSYADVLIDFAAHPAMGDRARVADGVYYHDFAHPTDLGTDILAALAADGIAQLIGLTPVHPVAGLTVAPAAVAVQAGGGPASLLVTATDILGRPVPGRLVQGNSLDQSRVVLAVSAAGTDDAGQARLAVAGVAPGQVSVSIAAGGQSAESVVTVS